MLRGLYYLMQEFKKMKFYTWSYFFGPLEDIAYRDEYGEVRQFLYDYFSPSIDNLFDHITSVIRGDTII